jgi:hypothetical protein
MVGTVINGVITIIMKIGFSLSTQNAESRCWSCQVAVLKVDCSWDGRYDGGVGSAGASVDRATNQDLK